MKSFARIVLITLLFPLILTDTAWAAGKLKGQLHATVIRRRTMGPMVFDAELEYNGSGIPEGNIVLKFQENLTDRTVVRFGPVGLTSGRQTFAILVPSVLTNEGQIECRLIFEPVDGDEIDLGTFQVMPVSISTRSTNVCVGDILEGANSSDNRLFDLARSLRLDQFHPKAQDDQSATTRDLSQAPTLLAADQFPADPLLFCVYDLVLLKGEALRGLKEKQLDALSRWVRGGGSLCLVPDRPLQQQHLDFVNGLCTDRWMPGPTDRLPAQQPQQSEQDYYSHTQNPGEPIAGGSLVHMNSFTLDAKGMLVTPGLPNDGIGLFRADLGRVALIARPYDLEKDPKTAAWRQMSAFLWKTRARQFNEMVSGLKWRTDQQYDPLQYSRYGYEYDGVLPLAPQPLTDGGSLINFLMPKTVRLIPGWVVATMMLSFLVVIGPGDYFILGFFKKRKYTWVLLPVVCGLFAWGTMALSNHYLGVKDQTQRLTIVDFGADGKPVRTNRLTLLFAGRQKTAYADHEKCYFADVTGAGGLTNQYDYYRPNRQADTTAITLNGRVPARYRSGQSLQQWTAQVNREFSFEPPEKLVFEPQWNALNPKRIGASNSLYNTLGVPSDLPCAILVESVGQQVSEGWVSRNMPAFGSPGYYGIDISTNWLHRLGAYTRTGFMSIVSQISPHGGPLLEDLAIHDETDSNEYAVHILVKYGDDFVLYRRIYRAEE